MHTYILCIQQQQQQQKVIHSRGNTASFSVALSRSLLVIRLYELKKKVSTQHTTKLSLTR